MRLVRRERIRRRPRELASDDRRALEHARARRGARLSRRLASSDSSDAGTRPASTGPSSACAASCSRKSGLPSAAATTAARASSSSASDSGSASSELGGLVVRERSQRDRVGRPRGARVEQLRACEADERDRVRRCSSRRGTRRGRGTSARPSGRPRARRAAAARARALEELARRPEDVTAVHARPSPESASTSRVAACSPSGSPSSSAWIAGTDLLAARDLLDDLGERQVGRAFGVRDAAAGEDARLVHERPGELGGEARLADPRLAEHHDPAAGRRGGGLAHGKHEALELGPATHERRVGAARDRRRALDELDEPVPTLGRLRPRRAGRLRSSRRPEQDLPLPRALLHPPRCRQRPAREDAPVLADEHLARLHRGSHRKGRERVAELHRRPERAENVVLVGGGQPEHRERLLPQQLLDPATVAQHDLLERREPARDQPARRLDVQLVVDQQLDDAHRDAPSARAAPAARRPPRRRRPA